MPVSVQPHSINVSQEVLDDLHGRLRNVRWPEEVPGTGWTRGVDLKFMKDLVEYWLEEDDWRKKGLKVAHCIRIDRKVDILKHAKGMEVGHRDGHAELVAQSVRRSLHLHHRSARLTE